MQIVKAEVRQSYLYCILRDPPVASYPTKQRKPEKKNESRGKHVRISMHIQDKYPKNIYSTQRLS